MMHAAKHGDPQLGIDIHLCVTPVTVPLPTPHLSIVFDPIDYIPIIGATVTVGGMKRATAGTGGIVVHIPPGFPFAPKFPDKDDELFMGSSTVIADGDPMSHIAHPVLGCQIVGMMSPPRAKKKNKNLMLLPTTFNLAIPTNVFVGGPPTISLMGMAFKAGFSALGKFAKSGLFKRIRQGVFENFNDGFIKCKIFRAEPVNILTGAVSVEQSDFTLPGRLPIEWSRIYSSDNKRDGCCGHGWETPADIRLEVDPADGAVILMHPGLGPLLFDRLPAPGEEAELELMDGARLSHHPDEYQVRTKEDRIYRFGHKPAGVNQDGHAEYPLRRIDDLCGNALEFERSGGALVGIRESSGRRFAVTTERGRITEIALCLSGEERHVYVRYDYDKDGALVAVRDALNHPYTFAYDQHHMTRHTDRNGLSFYYAYDPSADGTWRVEHAWGDGGLYDYRFEYHDLLNQRRITDSLGHVCLVKLDERGLPISELDPLDGITTYEYDDACRTTAVNAPGGLRTGYQYDQRGNLLKLTRPDGKTISTEFNDANKAVAITDPGGGQWQQSWDARGLLVEQTGPLGHATRYEYDRHGQLIASTNPRGARTELAFDKTGQLTALKDPLGHRTRFAYDPLGQLTGKTDPLERQTRYHYDPKGRLLRVVLSGGAAITCAYDLEDNLISHVDEAGQETRLQYYGQGEIKRRTQPDGHSVEYHYDTEEQLIGLTNQRGETYLLNRDPLGRIIEEIDYWGQARRYAYNPSGHLTAATDPLGQTIHYATDPLGRILKKTLPDGSKETYAYDANGNLVETANPHGSIKRQFDPEGNLLEETQGAFRLTNSYDENGNRTTRETSLGNQIACEYDLLDQAVAVRINQDQPIRIQRDEYGRIAREKLGPQLARDFRYSADGYLTEQAVTLNNAPLFATNYEYDQTGNLSKRSDSHYGTDTYRYDPMGRITAHIDPQGQIARYLNDPAGDRLQTRIVEATETAPVANQPETAPTWHREGQHQGTRYRFDRAGNLVEKHGKQQDLHLSWDANHRLTESRANGTVTRYGYDPLGRRLFKQTDDRRTQFYWDGDALVGETESLIDPPDETPENTAALAKQREKLREALSKKTREYVYYPATFEPLAMLRGSADEQQVYHYHNDPNGCPTRLTDEQGQVAWAARYDAWGKVDSLPIHRVDQPLRLQGQYADGETGLSYNRHRYYDAEIGSFVSQDPLGLAAGENVYVFAPNVQGWVDPLGLKCKRYAKYAKKATQNPNSLELVLGKTLQDGIGYKKVAENLEATYFYMKNWDRVRQKIGIENMWNINKAFLNQQLKAGKKIFCSHDPWESTGYFQDELLHLIDSGATDFVEVGPNLWKVVF
jgi:RHS repeat-associated protein